MPDAATPASSTAHDDPAPQDRIAAALERIAESLEVLARVAVEYATTEDDEETGQAADPPDELDDGTTDAAAIPPTPPPALDLARLADLS